NMQIICFENNIDNASFLAVNEIIDADNNNIGYLADDEIVDVDSKG
ncbi:9332_t:CDS:2, partial [Entrophospora sp. SA101]